ncbi:hypothetical protein ACFXGE_46340, partial [Streptomyces sp. NPDC059378]
MGALLARRDRGIRRRGRPGPAPAAAHASRAASSTDLPAGPPRRMRATLTGYVSPGDGAHRRPGGTPERR